MVKNFPVSYHLIFASIIALLGGSFQFGYHIGCINPSASVIQRWFNQSYYSIHRQYLDTQKLDLYWAITVSIFSFGGMIGGMATGVVAEKFGRKVSLHYNNIIITIATLFMMTSKYFNIFYFLIIGRFLIGIGCGMASGLVPLFLTEISPTIYRGMFGSLPQLFIVFGILFSTIICYRKLLGTTELWPHIFTFSLFPAIVQIIGLYFISESPKYLLISKKDEEKSYKALKKFRVNRDVTNEFDEIKNESINNNSEDDKVAYKDMLSPPLRWPLIISIMMMLSQQFSGINAAIFYSTKIFENAGMTGDIPYFATLAISIINLLMTIVSIWLVDHPKCGRRMLHLSGLIGVLFMSIFIVVSLLAAQSEGNLKNFGQYASILSIVLFVIFFALGPGSIPWFYVNEIFDSNARAHASSIACLCNWLASFIVGIIFLPLNNVLGPYTFLVFSAFLVIFISFTFKFVPETKGKTISEIKEKLA
uniref:Facilitated glucose transporter homolog (inferred by orthology to a C. elegans protein) n=1 Tax=Strongyloides venezuelensis TaxID=75913 RepID=A0A0K0G500_STRVS